MASKRLTIRHVGRGGFLTASGHENQYQSGFSSLLNVPNVFISGRSQGNFTDFSDYSVPFPVTDRRIFNPEKRFSRPAVRFSGRPARVIAPQARKARLARSRGFSSPFFTGASLAFANPRSVAVCVRRGVRREVLHAKGVAGSRGLRRPKRNHFSSIRC